MSKRRLREMDEAMIEFVLIAILFVLFVIFNPSFRKAIEKIF
jgi:hypothetical protein